MLCRPRSLTNETPSLSLLKAIGCVHAELVRGEPLWPGKTDVDQLHLIRLTLGQLIPKHLTIFRNNQYFAGITLPDLNNGNGSGLRMKLTVPVDEAALNMLKACLNKDPSLRPNAETLLRHNYFAGLSIPDFLERSISAHKSESKSNGNLSGKPPSVYSKYAKSVQLNGVINSSLNKYKVWPIATIFFQT